MSIQEEWYFVQETTYTMQPQKNQLRNFCRCRPGKRYSFDKEPNFQYNKTCKLRTCQGNFTSTIQDVMFKFILRIYAW